MSADGSNGMVVGLVKSVDDPDRLGRVQVTYPHLQGMESGWAKLVSPMAGKRRGIVFRPEPQDEVLIAFEHGDPRRPYVLGALWSKPDQPPADNGSPGDNHWRFIRSRSGHLLKFDDTPGAERIELEDKDGKRRLVIDVASEKICLAADSGEIEIRAPAGKVVVEAAQVTCTATKKASLDAPEVVVHATTKLTLASDAQIEVNAAGALTLKGSTVAIN